MTRYALYFAPAADSPWWSAGCRWLGRDSVSGAELAQRQIPGISREMLAKFTCDARRYGFHATLKAPFRLINGYSPSHLEAMAETFSATQRPVVLQDMRVHLSRGFLALRPAGPDKEIRALAMRCVSYFDELRAPPTEAELAKRRRANLTELQEALLQRWGYPYTEGEFNFHMTLTSSLSEADAAAVSALRRAAERQFAAAQAAPLVIDALTIFCEQQPGQPFHVWRRFPFPVAGRAAELPRSVYRFPAVAPSGVSKDTLLR
jgi:putative phosphonate metabolism protein